MLIHFQKHVYYFQIYDFSMVRNKKNTFFIPKSPKNNMYI